MPFHVDYRPTSFEEVIGNKEVITSLRSLVEQENPVKSYLICGPAGVGKTTLARIIAKKFGASSERSIVERNAASMNGIDDMRQLLEFIATKQPGCPSTVVILDECHQLTPQAQNALLKTLEEPPKHAYIILATTDPQNLLDTIRSRCAEYMLNAVTAAEVVDLILKVCGNEGITPKEDILKLIVDKCQGSPRLALTLLERVRECENVEDAAPLIDRIIFASANEGEKLFSKRIFNIMIGKDANKWEGIAKEISKAQFEAKLDAPSLRVGLQFLVSQRLVSYGAPQMGAVLEVLTSRTRYDYMSWPNLIADVFKITLILRQQQAPQQASWRS